MHLLPNCVWSLFDKWHELQVTSRGCWIPGSVTGRTESWGFHKGSALIFSGAASQNLGFDQFAALLRYKASGITLSRNGIFVGGQKAVIVWDALYVWCGWRATVCGRWQLCWLSSYLALGFLDLMLLQAKSKKQCWCLDKVKRTQSCWCSSTLRRSHASLSGLLQTRIRMEGIQKEVCQSGLLSPPARLSSSACFHSRCLRF